MFGCFRIEEIRDNDNETDLKEGGGLEISIYSAFHIRKCTLSFALNTYQIFSINVFRLLLVLLLSLCDEERKLKIDGHKWNWIDSVVNERPSALFSIALFPTSATHRERNAHTKRHDRIHHSIDLVHYLLLN